MSSLSTIDAVIGSLKKSPMAMVFLFIALFSTFFFGGMRISINDVTDVGSDAQAYHDALSISRGEHKFGIVRYTHYPNGPSYILLPFVSSGIYDSQALRTIPIFFSAIIFALFFLIFLRKAKTHLAHFLMTIFFISIVFQPGIIDWMGDLHEHAYSMASIFGIILLGYYVQKINVVFLVLGFLLGWIGYDFIPAQITTMLLIRFIKHSEESDSLWLSLIRSVKETSMAVIGVVGAVMTHFIQIILFYGSVEKAFVDFFGSLEARTVMNTDRALNPEYVASLAFQKETVPSRGETIVHMFMLFLQKTWTKPLLLASVLLVGIASNIMIFFSDRVQLKRYFMLLGIVLLLSAIASCSWIILMKYHAAVHEHFIPRLFFVAYINLAAFLVIKSNYPRSHDKSLTQGRE